MTYTVNATLTREDFTALVVRFSRVYKKARYFHWFRLLISIVAYIYLVSFVACTDMEIFLYFVVFFLSIIISLIVYKRQIYKLSVADGQYILSEHDISFNEKGVTSASTYSSFFVAWEGITKIEQTQKYFYFFIDIMHAFCVPLRCFKTPDSAKEFYEEAQKYWAKTHKIA